MGQSPWSRSGKGLTAAGSTSSRYQCKVLLLIIGSCPDMGWHVELRFQQLSRFVNLYILEMALGSNG